MAQHLCLEAGRWAKIIIIEEQGKSEGFDSCDRPNNLAKTGFKSLILLPVWPWNLMDDFENNISCSILRQAMCIISKQWVNSNWSYSPETQNSGQNQWFFLSRVTLKFNGCSWKTILAQRKDYHGVSSGWSSVWHRSNTGLSSTQYEQIPIILGVWPFWLTPFFFGQ